MFQYYVQFPNFPIWNRHVQFLNNRKKLYTILTKIKFTFCQDNIKDVVSICQCPFHSVPKRLCAASFRWRHWNLLRALRVSSSCQATISIFQSSSKYSPNPALRATGTHNTQPATPGLSHHFCKHLIHASSVIHPSPSHSTNTGVRLLYKMNGNHCDSWFTVALTLLFW